MQFVSTLWNIRDLSLVLACLMTLIVLSAAVQMTLYMWTLESRAYGAKLSKQAFVFSTSCPVEIVVTFLMTGADSSFSSMLYKFM